MRRFAVLRGALFTTPQRGYPWRPGAHNFHSGALGSCSGNTKMNATSPKMRNDGGVSAAEKPSLSSHVTAPRPAFATRLSGPDVRSPRRAAAAAATGVVASEGWMRRGFASKTTNGNSGNNPTANPTVVVGASRVAFCPACSSSLQPMWPKGLLPNQVTVDGEGAPAFWCAHCKVRGHIISFFGKSPSPSQGGFAPSPRFAQLRLDMDTANTQHNAHTLHLVGTCTHTTTTHTPLPRGDSCANRGAQIHLHTYASHHLLHLSHAPPSLPQPHHISAHSSHTDPNNTTERVQEPRDARTAARDRPRVRAQHPRRHRAAAARAGPDDGLPSARHAALRGTPRRLLAALQLGEHSSNRRRRRGRRNRRRGYVRCWRRLWQRRQKRRRRRDG